MEAEAGWEFTIELVDRLDHLKVAAIQLFLSLLPILIIIPLILLFRLLVARSSTLLNSSLALSVCLLLFLMSSATFVPVYFQLHVHCRASPCIGESAMVTCYGYGSDIQMTMFYGSSPIRVAFQSLVHLLHFQLSGPSITLYFK